MKNKENNLFPPLDFPSNANEMFKYPNQQSEDKVPVPRRSLKRKKTSQPLNDVTLFDQQQTHSNIEKNRFLLSLGSPKPSTVLGEILVHETPENQMFGTRMLDRRLRPRNYKLHGNDSSKAQLS